MFGLVLSLVILGTGLGFAGGQKAQEEPIEIVYWCPMAGMFEELIKGIVAYFTTQFPNIIVDHQYTGDYYVTQQKMLTAVVAGDPVGLKNSSGVQTAVA